MGGKVEYSVEPMADGRRFTARSILRLTPRKKHHNTIFTCQAQNTADRTFRAATITLQVSSHIKLFTIKPQINRRVLAFMVLFS